MSCYAGSISESGLAFWAKNSKTRLRDDPLESRNGITDYEIIAL